MRKMDLVHLHELGLTTSKFIANNQDIDFGSLFDEYQNIDVSGPYDVQAQKVDQEEAVSALFSDLASVHTDRSSEAEDNAETNTPFSAP